MLKSTDATRANLDVNGVRISVSTAGSGSDVLFLHGADGALHRLPFFDALAARHRLAVPDLPGFGYSENPALIRSLSDVAMFSLDLLAAHFPRGVHLVGHALGGWLAAEMAIRERALIRSLTLIAPLGLRIPGVPIGDNFIWSPEEAERALFVDPSFAKALAPADDAQLDMAVQNRFTAAKLGWQPRWYDKDLSKWLHRAEMPTLVVWGARDGFVPVAYAERWEQLVPHARRIVIDEAGHFPHVERSDATAAAVLAFLAEVSP